MSFPTIRQQLWVFIEGDPISENKIEPSDKGTYSCLESCMPNSLIMSKAYLYCERKYMEGSFLNSIPRYV